MAIGPTANRLNARQSENFTEFSLKASFKLHKNINVSLAMSSDPKKYFGFLVDETSESGHNIKWRFTELVFTIKLLNFRPALNLKIR